MEIVTSDITDGCVDGDGVFDQFQKAFADNIQQEYQKQRIRGPEYAKVYLGGMQSAMEQSIAFLMGRQKADKEAELIEEKIITEALVREKLEAEIVYIGKQGDLVDAQIRKIDAEILILGKDLETAEAKIWVTKAQVSNDTSITSPPTDITVSGGVLGNQVLKINSEKNLLDEKRLSESAQTKNVAAAESVLGKEILLRSRQADGFLRDAEQKLAKIVGDSYNIQFTTLDGLDIPVPSNFTPSGVDRIVNKAREGANA